MKSRSVVFAVLLNVLLNASAVAQQNPVENLTWFHTYENMENLYKLQWEEPAQPHDELIGYNIYRDGELYRFQTETSVFRIYSGLFGLVSNCTDNDFLDFEDGGGFDVHVTAVYNPGPTESGYLQTAHTDGQLLTGNNKLNREKVSLFPNPTTGILNIGNENLEKIVVYDTTGKEMKTFAPASQIDLNILSKGIYFIKLFSGREIMIDKIVVQ